MPQQVIVITGTSTGIGLEVAVQAAKAGHTVVATMRDDRKSARLREAAKAVGAEVEVRTLDVTDAGSIAACLRNVVSEHGRIDALVNNAGVAHLGTIETDPLDDIRSVMETNFFGVLAVTQAAMPLLRESRGRLVTITSVGGIVGQPFNETYCASKFAVEGYMEALAPVAATVGVRVSVVEPGAVNTEFVANAEIDPETMIAAAGPYAEPLRAYLARTANAFAAPSAQTPAQAAAPIVELLDAEAPPFRTQTSAFASGFAGTKLKDLDGSAVQTLTAGWIA